MPPTANLDELDRQIVHCLQIWPRAPWTLVGEVLEVDPMTVSRRWKAMEDEGCAWISVMDLIHASTFRAVLELRIKPILLLKAIEKLRVDPHISTLRQTLGEWQVVLDWQGSDLVEFGAWLDSLVSEFSGLKGVRTHVVTSVLTDGSSWRLKALSLDQAQTIREASRFGLTISATHEVHDIDQDIIGLVSQDGRCTVSSMAKSLDTTSATIRRHLNHLFSSNALVMRCELARSLSGWPVGAVLMCTVDPARLDQVSNALSRIPEIRAALTVIGRYNLSLSLWVRTLQDITAMEAHLARVAPQIRIEERSITSQMHKLMWVPLNEYGFQRQPHSA